MATPEAVQHVKNTPCKSGINRAFLTPCRRPGLGRKTKITHLNEMQSPVSISTDQHASKLFVNTIESINLESRHSSVHNTGSTSPSGKNINNKIGSGDENNMKSKGHHLSATDNDGMKMHDKTHEKIKRSLPNHVLLASNSQANMLNLEKNDSKSLTCNLNNDRDKSCSSNNDSRTRKTKLTKHLSMNKKTDSQDKATDVDDYLPATFDINVTAIDSVSSTEECAVNVEQSGQHNDPLLLLNKPNRKKRILYSSDEEDFVSLRKPMKTINNSLTEIWDIKVNDLKKQIKMKKARLADMKQAAVYKKLHDLEELKYLTMVWRKGCQESLRHLLQKIQDHGPMNMYTLMKNLNIPSTIIYNVDEDSFM